MLEKLSAFAGGARDKHGHSFGAAVRRRCRPRWSRRRRAGWPAAQISTGSGWLVVELRRQRLNVPSYHAEIGLVALGNRHPTEIPF